MSVPLFTGPPARDGEDEWAASFRHDCAALSEGLCPVDASRLQPVLTPKGLGGRCPTGHGWWWAGPTPGAFEGPYSVHWWAQP